MDAGSDELRSIWLEHRDTTVGRLAVLERAALAVLEGRLDPALRDAARREAHTLAGSIAFFGLTEASLHAKDLEGRYTGIPAVSDAPLIAELTLALRRAVEAPLPAPAAPSFRTLVIDPGPDLAGRLRSAAAARGSTITTAVDLGSAERELQASPPDAAIVGITMPSAAAVIRASIDLGVPVIAVGDGAVAAHRIASSEAGATTFLDRASPPAALIDAAMSAATRQEVLLGSRVLVVDDDPVVPQALRELLGWYGATVVGSADPGALWSSLEGARPDILVLDVEMPGLSGIELCRALRADPVWHELPVVFLTGTDDPETLRALLGAGADDCVRKPAGAAALADRLARVLERRGRERTSLTIASSARRDVLVVDDDPVIADILLRALAARGHSAEWIEDGVAAALALGSPARAPRVVLLDVDLPGIDGFGVLARAAAAGTLAVCRVIMLTVRSSEPEIVRALELGAFDHIAKPFSIPILMRRVQRALQP